jgi:hypothetical protein
MEDKKDLKPLEDVYMVGLPHATYVELNDIAKKQGKSVIEVTGEAVKKHIEANKGIQESTQRRILTEG